MYEQATIPVVNTHAYSRVEQVLRQVFASAAAEKFLKQVAKDKLRVRDFEAVLQAGKLGTGVRAEYSVLPDSDKAQIREMYLRKVEQVAPELRRKYMKVYAYY